MQDLIESEHQNELVILIIQSILQKEHPYLKQNGIIPMFARLRIICSAANYKRNILIRYEGDHFKLLLLNNRISCLRK